ncbi:MAG: response regulator [Gemmatimonadales bacterium]|nr:MAG: response regulator [Gemmatimonadales bacterium]
MKLVRPESRTRVPRPKSQSLSSSRVLVVEDHVHLRLILGRSLGRMGFRPEEAEDVDSALRLLRDVEFRRVLLDVNLPGGGGLRVFQEIEARRDDLRKGVIFMTGGFTDDAVESLVERSGLPILWKPFELRELERVLRS